MDAIQLYDKNAKPLDFWICGKCRKVTLNPLYSFGSDQVPRNTKESAELCCTDPVCKKCGEPYKKTCHRSNQHCDPCETLHWQEMREARLQAQIAKATEVEYESGMVFCDGYGSQDGWFDSLDDLVKWLEEYHFDDDTGEALPWPEWCFAGTKEVRKLDVIDAINSQLERLSEDGYEDMEILPSKELIESAEKFNAENEHAMTCWHEDRTRKVRIVKPECLTFHGNSQPENG